MASKSAQLAANADYAADRFEQACAAEGLDPVATWEHRWTIWKADHHFPLTASWLRELIIANTAVENEMN